MGITYEGATMSLDLLDRPNKYSNGFCHWPVPAWIKPDGTWVPSQTNFTSLADPAAVGSGHTALTTLMHEAGHAAHFANVKQPSPLFSQERSPTSVAYAENQSMFLDSLVGDSAWRAKYARDLQNNPIPFEILEEDIRATHPFAVFSLRAMLVVSYFEKALYELPDEQVTSENIQRLADKVEEQIQCGPSPRPLLSVPHLVSDEASCYYQGYTVSYFFDNVIYLSSQLIIVSFLSMYLYQYINKYILYKLSIYLMKHCFGIFTVGRNECPSNKRVFQGKIWLYCR